MLLIPHQLHVKFFRSVNNNNSNKIIIPWKASTKKTTKTHFPKLYELNLISADTTFCILWTFIANVPEFTICKITSPACIKFPTTIFRDHTWRLCCFLHIAFALFCSCCTGNRKGVAGPGIHGCRWLCESLIVVWRNLCKKQFNLYLRQLPRMSD